MRLTLALLTLTACSGGETAEAPTEAPATEIPDGEGNPNDAIRARAAGIVGALPADASNPENPTTDAKVALGKALYYDARLSKADDVSCNSCHDLAGYGVDGDPTSTGHEGQKGGRNAPTVYNAALHITQFWDGREPDVEAQAKGPILNPIEMAMPDADTVMAKVGAIDGYRTMFEAAFPGEADPMTYDNLGNAIGCFERGLLTPAPYDAWLGGDDNALTAEQLAGLQTFLDTGCTTCHSGAAFGGGMYMKMGMVNAYETADMGRYEVTQNDADKFFFKVPSLRNIDKTGPYLHDGSVGDLADVIRIMGHHQLGKELSADDIAGIQAFLGALTGEIDAAYTAKPELPGGA